LICSGAVALAAAAPCQGVVKKEANTYRHLLERRAELVAAWPGLDAPTRDRVAERLAGDNHGVPFTPVLEALATARGVEADPAFVLRGMLGVFALPEVVDPEGANPFCHDLQVTVYLPFRAEGVEEVELRVRLEDAGGDVVWQAPVEEGVSLADLLRYQGRITVPGEGLEDGAYMLRVFADVDGAVARPSDPELSTRIHVLRGFQARAEAVLGAWSDDALANLDPAQRPSAVDLAMWSGLSAAVSRVYFGYEPTPMHDAVGDLLRAERALAQHRAGGGLLDGMTGWIPLGVPGTGDGTEAAPPAVLRLRLPTDPKAEATPILFWSGAPVYDPRGARPTGPRTTDPGWLACELRDQPALADRPMAVLESTGRSRAARADLEAALEFATRFWGDRPVVLAAEREAAVVASLVVGDLRPRLERLFLIGGGSLHRAQLTHLAGLPTWVVGERATPAAHNLGTLQRLLDGEFGAVPAGLEVDVAPSALPFGIGLAAYLPTLAVRVAQ